jgi:hypothetical protein
LCPKLNPLNKIFDKANIPIDCQNEMALTPTIVGSMPFHNSITAQLNKNIIATPAIGKNMDLLFQKLPPRLCSLFIIFPEF